MTTTLAPTDTLFRYDPPTAPAVVAGWQRECARIAPPSQYVSWLQMVWVPGDPWAPVQRWMVYDMEPRAINPGGWYWDELDGPNPRTRGYYDQVLQRFVRSSDQALDLLTWQLYRATGCMGRPFWVLQGTTGGHRRTYTQAEERLLRLRELPTDPPLPGALPYCEPDRRTWDTIATYSRLSAATDGIRSLDPAKQKEAIRAANKVLLRELSDHVEAAVKDTRIRSWDGARRVDDEPAHLGAGYEQMEHRFIEGGI